MRREEKQWEKAEIRRASWAVLSSVHRKLADIGAYNPSHELYVSWVRASSEILRRSAEVKNADLVGGGG